MVVINGKYSFKRLAALRAKIRDKLIDSYSHVVLTGRHIRWMATDLSEVLPKVRYSVLKESLRSLIGQEMNEELMTNLSFRLSGNLIRLQHRKTVQQWHGQTANEWLPCYVVQAKPHTTKSQIQGTYSCLRLWLASLQE